MMQRLLTSSANSRLFSPSQRRRAWLALWAQDRRRGRLVASAPSELSLLDGLLAYWPMDEAGTGPRADALGLWTAYEFEYPDVLMPDSVVAMPGVLGNGARPNPGVWNFGLSPLATVLDVGQDFTVSMWFWRTADVGGGSHLFSIGQNLLISCGPPEDIGFAADLYGDGFTSEAQIHSPTSVPVEVWTHCALVRAGSTLTLYQDGSEAGSDAIGSPAVATGNLQIGPSWWGYQWGYEAHDEVGVWQRALSADEVGQLYNGGSGLAYELF